MKTSEKIKKLRAAIQDIIEGIEKGEKRPSPLGTIYKTEFAETVVIELKELLEEIDT